MAGRVYSEAAVAAKSAKTVHRLGDLATGQISSNFKPMLNKSLVVLKRLLPKQEAFFFGSVLATVLEQTAIKESGFIWIGSWV